MKTSKTYRFDKEVIEHAESNPLINSFADWASKEYRKEFLSKESLNKALQITKDKVVYLSAELKIAKNKHMNGLLSKKEKEFMKEATTRMEKGATFEGVYSYFVNVFKRPDVNRRQFRLFMEKHGKSELR